MKRMLLALALLVTGSQFANAQSYPNVNCAALMNSPLMCVKNMSHYDIVRIQATTGDFGASWISIPGGAIPPGGTSIVNFGNYGGRCNMNVYVQTNAGITHPYRGVDVCRNTSFNITDW